VESVSDFLEPDESRDDESDVLSGAFEIGVNSVDVFPARLEISAPTEITLTADDTDESNDDFEPTFDRDNPSTVHSVDTSLPFAYDPEAYRAQFDTGARISCSGTKHLFHGYRPFNNNRRSPVRIKAALGGWVVPEGDGFLRIPAACQRGYINVHAYYSPYLADTLISENNIMASTHEPIKNFHSQTIRKFFRDDDCLTGNLTLTCAHKIAPSKNILLYGVVLGGQCYSHPLILPDLPINHPAATSANSMRFALAHDNNFINECAHAVELNLERFKQNKHAELADNLRILPSSWKSIPFQDIFDDNIPVNHIKATTEKLLWHQRLGHPCDKYLYAAHKSIIGVPKFKQETEVLNQCPTCIRAKQSKQPPGRHSTRVAMQPYQGLSIDFSFSGVQSADDSRRIDYEGLNGETSWILITDHFTGMKHGDTRISKAAPLHWLRHFLSQYNPRCNDKYVYMDQGGELFNNPNIRNLFEHAGYTIYPTGADSSHQNGPVERGHRTLANSIRALLLGANLDVKFWPYAFYHAMRLSNAFPEAGQHESPILKATSHKEDLTGLRTFGCRVWVRPPGHRKAKFKTRSRKGIFLGYVPYTTRNILWYDVHTHRVKIANHARFDEGMNDLPISDIPPNVQHIQRTDDGHRLTAERQYTYSKHFTFHITPFADLLHTTIRPTDADSDPTFGLEIRDDEILQRAYIGDVTPKSAASRLFSSLRATRNKIRGAYVISIDNDRVFSAQHAYDKLKAIHDQGVCEQIPITFAPERKLSATQVRKAANEYGLFAPTTKWDDPQTVEDPPFLERTANTNMLTATKAAIDKAKAAAKDLYTKTKLSPNTVTDTTPLHAHVREHLAPNEDDLDITVPSIDLYSLRAIAKLRHPSISFEEEDIASEIVALAINAIQSKATTPEEQALGHFTRRKLKRLSTWNEWEAGERKQLKQFNDLQMFGEPILPPTSNGAIILRPHWQYHIKRDGTRRARLCCNGSKFAAPMLHAIAMTYSSCVEHPIQRLFFAISAQLNLKIYGGDAKDAYAHSPGPAIPTYITIDDQYADWYKYTYGKEVDRSKVLPVRRALQGHPESGRLWETHINKILVNMGFITTTHDKTIYKTTYNGETVYMLRQVDDFALACKQEETAKAIYKHIGQKLRLPKEDKDPFSYLGLIHDFNGIDVKQTTDYIQISCSNYIDRIMTSHGWEKERNMQPSSKPTAPLSTETLSQINNHEGFLEGTKEHADLEAKAGFSYRTLLGEMMYAYVSCRPDIGYAITLMSKYSSKPSSYHYKCVKDIAKYLRTTKSWGIRYKRSCPHPDLEKGDDETIERDIKLPEHPEDISQAKLICFVDAAYANDPTKRRSTTGYAFTYSGGAIVYRSKSQSITALSSTEAELIAAVTAAKTARFLRSVLNELGFEQKEPTPIYEDNKSTIDIVNSSKPTERSRHIDIRFFAIQDWKARGDIVMTHIPGVINPADDLTKPLGWVLHSRHARYIMGHYNPPMTALE
jgi:hypothetical protein